MISGPPELPGLAAASNWIRLVRSRWPSGERNSRLRPETTPEETDGPIPKGNPDGDDFVAQREVFRRAHRGGHEIVGDGLRLEHGEIVFRLHADDGRFRLQPVGENHLDPLRPGDDVEVGQDDALVDDDDPGAHSLFGVHIPFLGVAQPEHAHDRGPDRLVGLCRPGGQGLRLQRLQHRPVDVLLGEAERRRLERGIEERRDERQQRTGRDEQELFESRNESSAPAWAGRGRGGIRGRCRCRAWRRAAAVLWPGGKAFGRLELLYSVVRFTGEKVTRRTVAREVPPR